MQRRTFIQAITAFLAGFFGFFQRLGRKPELAPQWLPPAPRVAPTGPRGIVSPVARWYSPTSYTLVENTSKVTQERNNLFQAQLAEYRPLPEGVVPGRMDEVQPGYVVMHLRNPARDPRHVPTPVYVTPTEPKGKVAPTWSPRMGGYRPENRNFPDAGSYRIGYIYGKPIADRFDISNDVAFDAVPGTARFEPSAEDLDAYARAYGDRLDSYEWNFSPEAQARVDANMAELEANWERDYAVS